MIREEEYNDSTWCREYLKDDEYVKWSGKSKSAGYLRYLFLAVAIPANTFLFYSLSTNLLDMIKKVSSGEESIITLIIFSLALIAWLPLFLSLTFGLFVLPGIFKKKTLYAVTNKKVVQKLGKSVKVVNLEPLPQIQMSVTNRKGYGTVTIGTTYIHDNSGFMHYIPWTNKSSIVLYNIDEPDKVYRMITNN